ncbi:hypothetical protein [Pedobacter duraquae]|uniref:hypothetical protein n=1 Tax=Pedobacter duraquae TaxID=425511 RepID=UPI001060E60E|nr:hypothetical protein [Pedobacter duraquae]
MNTLSQLKSEGPFKPDLAKIALMGLTLILLWQLIPMLLRAVDQTSASIDPSIWMLILLGSIAHLGITALSWLLLKWFWKGLGLPSPDYMVTHFKTLELWQQLSFFWGSFALLLLAGAMSLIAIC